MAILSMKFFDDELLKRLKATAALAGKTLQDHVTEVLWASERKKTK